MKKWLPFSLLMFMALIAAVYLVLSGQTENYRPQSGDPVVIYQEACAECHGKQGEGSALLYPALGEKEISRRDVVEIIREGAFMMPAFPQIPDTTLLKLSSYIMNKEFKKSAPPE